MFRLLLSVSMFLGAAVGLTAMPPKFPDWPQLPTIPDVMPVKPASGDVSVLPKGVLYVVTHNGDPAQLLVSPSESASVREYAGKVAIDGVFADAKIPGESEFREYEAKQVFVVKRLQPGKLELLKAPKGPVERRVLTDTGPSPKPPDVDPTPPPKPKPDPAPTPAKSFRVIFVHESGKPMTAGQVGVVYGRALQEYLDKTTTATDGGRGWRIRDPHTHPDKGTMGEMFKAGLTKMKATDPPCVFVEKDGHIEIIPIEEKPEAMIAVFNEYVTGKK